LRADLVDQLPKIAAWLAGEAVIGILPGMSVAVILNLALRHLRGLPRRAHELRHRGRQLLAAAIVTVFVVQIGVATYEPGWNRRSRLSGTLATLQLFPGQLQHYYDKHSKPADVLSAVSLIQANLQQRITRANVPPTAFNILLVSDLHLASSYPIVAQYAKSFGVSLVLNTGDEAEFGTALEMTPKYLAQLRGLTDVAPMVWVAGNHDSSTTARIMRQVPGVTVLGSKESDDGEVFAQQMTAYGLRIMGIPDPRIYGGPGELGSNDPSVVHELETSSVDRALLGVPADESFDIVATHEPIAADRAVGDLDGRVRQINAGHLHMQNPDSALQRGGLIRLIEGSTGAGGLDNLNARVEPPPVEFSIESVAANCQFTKVVRFQIRGTAPTFAKATAGRPPQVTATTHYFLPQRLDQPDRTCDVASGLTSPVLVAAS
jgi:predicted MPP superfamily phosphohydrolase